MKKIWMFVLLSVVFAGACSNPASQLKGTWKVTDVKTNFGKTKLAPEVMAHIIAEQKALSFKIVNDSVIVLILNHNTHEAKWKMDKDNNITYSFSSQPGIVNKLGKWNGKQIVSDTKTPLGDLIVIFEKK